jgi:DNA-binding XRE family transcriptional regulator
MKERIDKVIKSANLNPSEFADLIGISRSSINHILTERNNPSLDVVVKILSKFDTVNSDWLLFGNEPMYKTKSVISPSVQQPSLFDQAKPEPRQVREISVHLRENEETTPLKAPNQPVIEQLPQKIQDQKKITKILIFYSDNTFDSLSPDF